MNLIIFLYGVYIAIIVGCFALLLLVFERVLGKCIVTHNWGEWEEYEETFYWGGEVFADDGNIDSEIESMGNMKFKGTEIRKKRVCKICGKVQDKFIGRLYL